MITWCSPCEIFICISIIIFCYYVLHHSINISVETLSLYVDHNPKGKSKMKSILSTIWQFMCDIGQASYAAHLVRTGRAAQAQAMYTK